MRSKYSRRITTEPPRNRRTSQVLVGLVLVVIGASVALSATWIVGNTGSHGTPTATPSGAPASALAAASTGPASSAASSAAPSASPAAPVLEAEMPHAVNGTTLTTESATDAVSLGSSPSNRALDAAVTSLGKKPADLEVADAYDASGALALSILGFRIAGVDPTRLRSAVLDAWLSAGTPGVKSSSVSLSGTPSTVVSYGDTGPSEYLFVHGDSVFIIETTQQSLAASAVAAMPSGTPASSPGTSPAASSPSAATPRPSPAAS